MSILEIFGVCFIIEIAIIVTALMVSLIINHMDKIQKRNTYKEMLAMESKLMQQQKKEEEKNNADKPIEQQIQEEKLSHTNPMLNKILEGALSEGYIPEDDNESKS